MENYGIDSHKLMYHPSRVTQWRKEGDCYPIYVEISPSGKCNHRCIFCALDYMGYNNPLLDTEVLTDVLEEISTLGIKAVMFAGEGEPLLHPDIGKLIQLSKLVGLDVAVTTNGVFLNKVLDEVIDNCTWIRVSLDAASASVYSDIHGCNDKDYYKVSSNLADLVNLKKKKASQCTIGVQLLLLNKNYSEVVQLAGWLKSIGVDYLVVKPYSQHPLSKNAVQAEFVKERLDSLRVRLKDYSKDSFSVIFRQQAINRVSTPRSYQKCLGLPFFCYISSLGEVYPCSTYLGEKEYMYGNINENTFEEIWNSQQRRDVLHRIDSLDISTCRENCRLDPINQYLWELTNPPAHVNFI